MRILRSLGFHVDDPDVPINQVSIIHYKSQLEVTHWPVFQSVQILRFAPMFKQLPSEATQWLQIGSRKGP